MFTRLKQKVKEESSSDTTSPILSASTNHQKSLAKSISSSETGNNSSDEGGGGTGITQEEIYLENSNNNDSNESTAKNKIQKINSIEKKIHNNKNVSRTNSVTITDSQDELNNQNNESILSDSFKFNQESNIKFELKKLNESLLNQIEELTKELNEKLDENELLRSQLNKLNSQFEDNQYELENFKLEIENYKSIIFNYEKDIRELNKDKDELIIKNAELSEKYELLKLVNLKQQHTTSSKIENAKEDEHYLSNKIPNQDQNLIDECKLIRDELNEKNKVIKNLQHRINDMKKTLQKELKYQALPNEQNKMKNLENNIIIQEHSNEKNAFNYLSLPTTPTTTLGSNNFSSLNHKQDLLLNDHKVSRNIAASAETKHNQNRKYSISSSGTAIVGPAGMHSIQHLIDDVNFKYLKHVVLKFLTSKEYEALHLVKALSVLLNFSIEEEKLLKESLQYKMSWFGTRPKLL